MNSKSGFQVDGYYRPKHAKGRTIVEWTELEGNWKEAKYDKWLGNWFHVWRWKKKNIYSIRSSDAGTWDSFQATQSDEPSKGRNITFKTRYHLQLRWDPTLTLSNVWVESRAIYLLRSQDHRNIRAEHRRDKKKLPNLTLRSISCGLECSEKVPWLNSWSNIMIRVVMN